MALPDARPRLLRPDGDGSSEVAPIELFFDLVYVFAIVQVSHTLLAHLTPLGALETALLFGAVWWMWNYTAWAMNYLDPRAGAVRVLNAVLMLAALGMALALPEAFAEGGLLFAACYAVGQVGRPAFMWVTMRGHVLSRNYRNLLVWSAVAAALFVAGAFLPTVPRLIAWAIALAIDVAGPRFDYRVPGLGSTPMESWPADVEHLAERNRLVFIIALGESILIMGFTISELPEKTPYVFLIAVLGFVGLFALWWSYFALAGPETDASHGDGSTAALRGAFPYAHGLMVAGAILFAVAIELHITHPETGPALVLTSIGGPLLYLAGNILFLRSRTGSVARARYVAAGALVLVGIVGLALGHSLPAIALGVAVLAVVIALAAVTQLAAGREQVPAG
ncbi:low temperature requirement protein A [Pseudonocardia endophytica]|uniref:Low temperature requirement protein LtrA n=1 Tax=Pseudonocardia endophytica TaxID=401976 RepID=A0A4R1HSZ6_PSEEN|nr:low temperature requirement protein A [Pseudonocardia endophytica]TCK25777.1 low temperature requirement protein LtrA [Pseudonocardia endophytica]